MGLLDRSLSPEVSSSRVLSVGVGSSALTKVVEVTVGRGLMVLPEGSTVRRTVLEMVSWGVTVVTLVLGVWVLEELVLAAAALFITSTSWDKFADGASELVVVEAVDVEDVVCEVLNAVVSTPEGGGPCGM